MNSISLWPPKCCSLLRQPRFHGTCQVLDHTLLLYAAYLPTLLMSRHVSHSHQPRTAFSAGPLRQWNFRGGTIKILRAKCFPSLLSRTKAEYCHVCCVGPLPASSSQASSSVFSLERRVFALHPLQFLSKLNQSREF